MRIRKDCKKEKKYGNSRIVSQYANTNTYNAIHHCIHLVEESVQHVFIISNRASCSAYTTVRYRSAVVCTYALHTNRRKCGRVGSCSITVHSLTAMGTSRPRQRSTRTGSRSRCSFSTCVQIQLLIRIILQCILVQLCINYNQYFVFDSH